MPIITPIQPDERQLMQKTMQTTRDKNHYRRLAALLMLDDGISVSDVAKHLQAARSTVGRWINWFTQSGAEGLESRPAGRPPKWSPEPVLPLLSHLVDYSPQDVGWLRSRWSLELLTMEINGFFNINASRSTLYRWVKMAGLVWRRAAPTLKLSDPDYDEKMTAIQAALAVNSSEHPVFYQDEVDIALNPKIGADWSQKGNQKRIVTPGQNQKHYLAGALHADTGKVTYIGGIKKTSKLFINLLVKLKRTYRHASIITLIVDNYIIHKSKETQRWLAENPKFNLLFLPTYSPWLNRIEGLWHKLHETVTRNHHCHYMWQLLQNVAQFMEA
ncbi:IS630 family transposase, partial [Pectobacterium araliae]